VKSSVELRKELAAAEERERAEIRARKEAVRPIFEYTIMPTEGSNTASYSKLYDPTCLLYEIRRTTANRVAARVAGWTEDEMKEGGGTYLYNVVTRRIICALGGGTLYINKSLTGPEDFADDTAMFHIGAYLAEYPGGGDITYIVENFKATRKAATAT
jgi:hypothetical protein